MRTPDSFCVQICAFHSDKATAPREPSREQGAVSAAWAWWPKTRKHGNTGTEAPQRPKHENTKTRKHRPPGGSQNTKTRKHGPPGGDQNTKTRKHENTENTAWGYKTAHQSRANGTAVLSKLSASECSLGNLAISEPHTEHGYHGRYVGHFFPRQEQGHAHGDMVMTR